jgi:putative DNA primase/helicase
VVILPDNDVTGRLHAQHVARSLHPAARPVRILALPGLPPESDVSDRFEAGGTPAQLLEMAADVAVTPPPAPDLDARFDDFSDLRPGPARRSDSALEGRGHGCPRS